MDLFSFILGGVSYSLVLSTYHWAVQKFRRRRANVSSEGEYHFHKEWLEPRELNATETVEAIAASFYMALTETLGESKNKIRVNKNDFQTTTVSFDVKSTVYRGKLAELAKKKAERDYARPNRS